jgi:uncharacterized protein DUF222
MFERLQDALTAAKAAADDVDLGRVSGPDAAALVVMLTEAERVLAAVRTLASRRLEKSKAWQKDGHRTAAEWVAAKTGTLVGQAIGVLETGRQLEELPLTRDAFRSGRLSEIQAREVSDAAFADPKRERALLETARTETVKALREECRRVKTAAMPDDLARIESIRRRRYFRHWTENDGAVRLDARLTPDAGAEVVAAVDAARGRIIAEARKAGAREPSDAYAADALVELVSHPPSDGPRAMVHVLVDHEALRSGTARADQRCEIPGIGRIPVQTARALAEDSILKVLVTKGVDVRAVATRGRTISARIRTALELRDPTCVVPGCDKRRGLEIDHYRVAFADGGSTTLDNLARICRWHHYQKTHLGCRLNGRPGAWAWETPSDLEGATAGARPRPDG